MASKEKEFIDACGYRRWDEAKALIIQNPQLMWTAHNEFYGGAAFYAALSGNIEMLEFMLGIILSLPLSQEQCEQVLRNTFEKEHIRGDTVAHIACCGGILCLKFLVEHSPSGSSILNVKSKIGCTPAHFACRKPDVLEFIVRNSNDGILALEVKNNNGKTPLDTATKEVKDYFTPTKIMELGLECELNCIPVDFTPNSLPALVFTVMRQTIEVQLWRLRNKGHFYKNSIKMSSHDKPGISETLQQNIRREVGTPRSTRYDVQIDKLDVLDMYLKTYKLCAIPSQEPNLLIITRAEGNELGDVHSDWRNVDRTMQRYSRFYTFKYNGADFVVLTILPDGGTKDTVDLSQSKRQSHCCF